MGVAVGTRVEVAVGGTGVDVRVSVGGKVMAIAVGKVTAPGAVGVAAWQAGKSMLSKTTSKRIFEYSQIRYIVIWSTMIVQQRLRRATIFS
jgi:hypothetical protein